LASSEKMLKMLEEAGVESDSSQQDPDASSYRDNKKLQASSVVANTERQSGDSYPTKCGSGAHGAPAKALKIVREAFHIYSSNSDRRDYIRNTLSGDNVNGVLIVSPGTWSRGNYWCVNFKGYEIWMT